LAGSDHLRPRGAARGRVRQSRCGAVRDHPYWCWGAAYPGGNRFGDSRRLFDGKPSCWWVIGATALVTPGRCCAPSDPRKTETMNRRILSLTFAAWIIAVPGIALAQTAHNHQQLLRYCRPGRRDFRLHSVEIKACALLHRRKLNG